MYCQYCGTQNSSSAKFCQKCGKPISHIAEPEQKPNPITLHCPECNSYNIAPADISVYRSHINNRILKLHMRDGDIRFFECRDCGDICVHYDDLCTEIRSKKIAIIVGSVLRIILFLIAAFLVSMLSTFIFLKIGMGMSLIIPGIAVLIIITALMIFFATFPFIEKNLIALKEMKKEKEYLWENSLNIEEEPLDQ